MPWKPDLRLTLLAALSMSLAWRIRGQFGHEIGATIAGALGALAIALLSGREDWQKRAPHFALLGALGWAFGGSMSYMKVVGYCHSSDSATVLYGFAGLFLIGFLWAAMGGAGTALPALIEEEKLGSLYPALAAVFGLWFVADVGAAFHRMSGGSLGWRDSDWYPATVALLAALGLALFRKRLDFGTSLIMHLAAGWWAGMLLLVVALDLHLNPPRGENWAGCLGLFAGLMLFCVRQGLKDLALLSVVTGLLGGIGFVLGQAIKLAFLSSGATLRLSAAGGGWHCVMEWIHGLLFGLALAIAMAPLGRRGPTVSSGALPRWTRIFAVFFVLWVIPYLNFRKSPALWRRTLKSLPDTFGGLPVTAGFDPSRGFLGWFELLFLLLGAVLVWAMLRRSALVPESPPGRGQLLFLVFQWSFVIISFAHVLPEMTPFLFLVQWVIAMQAIACTALVLHPARVAPPISSGPIYRGASSRMIVSATLLGILAIFAGWSLKRALYGDTFAVGFYMDHIRFGPNHTNNKR
ncbi:MAG: hypothetical protein ACKV22_17095 [Bryobacteraceae bacterium]